VLYTGAAQYLQRAVPEVIGSYQNALRVVRSPLAMRKESWRTCHDQAVSIIEDCVAALNGEKPSDPAQARRYSRFVGQDRAEQGIAVAESVRAVEILWGAMQPAIRAAVQCEAPPRRTAALLLINTAFRSSAGSRLYAGAIAYGNTATRPEEADGPAEPGAAATPARSAAYEELSERERQVLDGVARALTNDQIGRELGIKTATVKRHLNNIYGKLQAESRIDAVNKVFGRPAGPGSRSPDPEP
jgi:DNA-binding CsgD family transcriptional regulator